MSAGMFPSPGCGCCGCVVGGMFVYAEKTMHGWLGPEWFEYPAVVDLLYRKVVIDITIEWFTADLSDGHAVPWTTQTQTRTYEWNVEHDCLEHILIEGSLNDIHYEKTLNIPAGGYTEFTLDPDDYVTELSPLPSPWNENIATDMPGSDLSVSFASGYDCINTAVGSGNITSVITWADHPTTTNGFNSPSIVTRTVTMSESFSAENMAADAMDMLASVPLSKTRLAANNLVSLAYVSWTGHYPLKELQETTSTISTDDDTCLAGENREQTYTPAARQGAAFITGATGDGTLYEEGSGACGGMWEPSETGDLYATAHVKKGLLGRTDSDDWVVSVPYDPVAAEYDTGAATCLGTDVTVCYRYFYPSGGDDGGSGANAINFTLSADGIIYREILELPTAIAPCPTGILGFTNPCG